MSNIFEKILFDENMFFIILDNVKTLKDSLSLISICKYTLKHKGKVQYSRHFLRFKHIPDRCSKCNKICWAGFNSDSKRIYCLGCTQRRLWGSWD